MAFPLEMTMDDIDLLTVEETATQLKVQAETVRDWLRAGKLKGVKAGRQWRVRRRDLEAFLIEPEPPTPEALADAR
jgi:excisionase family DNA binding protein